MQEIISRLETVHDLKKMMRDSCRTNGVPSKLSTALTVLKLKQLHHKFKESLAHPQSWQENEMKAFGWVLLALSAFKQAPICRFRQPQWEALQQLFPSKDPKFLRYEATRFLKQRISTNRRWSPKQDQKLKGIVEQHQKQDSSVIPWNEVARRLFEESDEDFFRLSKHCREHWFNYLDPSKERGDWKLTEEVFLLEQIVEKGKKWSKIASIMHRTEHMVKNRFNSMLIKYPHPSNAHQEKDLISKQLNRLKTQIQQAQRQRPMSQQKPVLVQQDQMPQQLPSLRVLPSRQSRLRKPNSGELSLDGLEGMQDIQRFMKEGEPNSPYKSELKLLASPFVPFSPRMTPFMGSSSPFFSLTTWTSYSHNFTKQLKKQSTKQ